MPTRYQLPLGIIIINHTLFTFYSSHTSIRKISNFTADRDHSYRKQGRLPTPADILVGI